MLGKRINEIRKERGITAQSMADMLHINLRSYRNYESGDREPSVESIIKIADILDISVDYLFGRDEFIKKQNSIIK